MLHVEFSRLISRHCAETIDVMGNSGVGLLYYQVLAFRSPLLEYQSPTVNQCGHSGPLSKMLYVALCVEFRNCQMIYNSRGHCAVPLCIVLTSRPTTGADFVSRDWCGVASPI